MRKLVDAKGNEWAVRFTGDTALRLRDDLGIDVDRLLDGDNAELQKLFTSQTRLYDIMGIVFESQIENRRMLVERERRNEAGEVERYRALSSGFYECFNGETLDEFTQQLLWSITDSLPNLKRRAFQKVMAKLSPRMEQVATKMEARIEEDLKKIPIE